MNAIGDLLAGPAIERLGWALVHFVWQGVAVALLLVLALGLMRRRSANARYLACCAALLVMAACPVAMVLCAGQAAAAPPAAEELAALVALPSAEAPAVSMAPAPAVELPESAAGQALPLPQPTRRFWWAGTRARLEAHLAWLVAAWAAGVLALSLRLLAGWLGVRRIRRSGTGEDCRGWQEVLRRLGARMGVRRSVRLLRSGLARAPVVVGWLRPVILLPASALSGLTAEQLEAILAHELAHVRRHDYAVNLVQTAVETLLFYHPAVHWVSRRIRVEREQCCDDLAVEVCGDSVTYARALAEMAGLHAARSHVALAADGGSLLGRIRRIVGAGDAREAASSSRWLAGILAVGVVLALAAAPLVRAATAPVPAEAAPEQPAAPSRWRATLPNGGTIELLGLWSHVSAGRPWWAPDGTPLAQPPAKVHGGSPDWSPGEGWASYEWVCRVSPGPGGSVPVIGSCGFSPNPTPAMPLPGWDIYAEGPRTHASMISYPVDVESFTLRYRVYPDEEAEGGTGLIPGRYQVEFRNVSLKSGRKTDVEVVVGGQESPPGAPILEKIPTVKRLFGSERTEGAAEAATEAAGLVVLVEMALSEFADGEKKALSSPRLMLRDGKSGLIDVGTQRDYVLGLETPDDAHPKVGQWTEGMTFEVTPHVQAAEPDKIAVRIKAHLRDREGVVRGAGLDPAEVPMVRSREWEFELLLDQGVPQTVLVVAVEGEAPLFELTVTARALPIGEALPERAFNYPDKEFWKTVVEQRVPTAYPSRGIFDTASREDRLVREQLKKPVSLQFDATPLPQVVEMLQQITDVDFSLRRQDLPPGGAPVTLSIDTTLENALNQIAEQTGMAWQVKDGDVLIGSPESLRVYELRVYNVTDLLASIEDRSVGVGFGGGGGGYGRGYGGGGVQDLAMLTARAENLLLLIKQACGEGTWQDPAVGSDRLHTYVGSPEVLLQPPGRAFVMAADPQHIIVVQTAEVHKCIERLLREMRNALKVQVRLDVVALVFARSDLPADVRAQPGEELVQRALWHGERMTMALANGEGFEARRLGLSLRPIASADLKYVFLEVSGVARPALWDVATQGIPDGAFGLFLNDGARASAVARQWMGEEAWAELGRDDCVAALLVRPQIIVLSEEEVRLR